MSNPEFSKFYNSVSQHSALTSNRWKIDFTGLPSGINEGLRASKDSDLGTTLTIWARGTELPNMTQETATFAYQGQEMTMPTIAKLSNTTSLTFYARADLTDYVAFEEWITLMSNIDFDNREDFGSTGVAGGGDKLLWKNTNMSIDVMNPDMKESEKSYILRGIFPTTMSKISFTNDSPGLSEYTVDFAYQYWYKE